MFFSFTIRQHSLHLNFAKIKLRNEKHRNQRTYQNYAVEYGNVERIYNMLNIFFKKLSIKKQQQYICLQSKTTMSIALFSGNQFRSFRPSSGHRYTKLKRMVTCTKNKKNQLN